ncbi:MAG: hypothetical protein H7329_01295, partial [Opitutaceae bacterium]|nr:hypothetical protein [Cytophagales bacterium]
MKLHLPLGGFKVVFLFALIFLGIKDGFGQCPTAPTANPAGYLVTANSATGFTVGAGQTLVIQSGTYTGNIGGLNKTGVIYVAAGATFNPGNINSPAGKIINCGTASIPSFDIPTTAVGDSLFILNYNVMTLTGTYNTNGNNSSWLNGLGSKMTFTQSVTNFRDVTFINNGYVLVNGSFNTGAVTAPHRNSFINHDSITVTGDIVLDAAIKNDGFFFSIGNMTLNSGGNINNGCFFETDKAFNYSSSDTLFVTGLTWVDKAGGGGVAKFQGKYVKVLGNGFIQGSDFENNSTYFEGDGNLYFSGATKNQGGAAGAFGILSTASYHLNFYDATPTGTLYFDTQGNNPNALVTKSSIPAKNNTYVPGTCSDIIKGNFCKLSGNKPNAGSDVTICSAATTTALSGGSSTKNWSVLSGAAAITSQTGTVTGMAMYTSYQFILTDNSNAAKCTDTVKVTKITPPTVAAGANLSACASASPGRITLAGRSFGGSASSAAWSILSGGGALNNTLQTSRPDTVKYTPASNFSGTVKLRLYSNVPTNCTVASDTLDIEVSPRPTAVITGNQIICSGTATGNISIALTGSQPWSLTYSDGTTPISKTGITSSPYTFTVSPTSTKTYTVTALSDAKCAAIVGDMTGGAIISVDPTSVGGTVTSSKNVCRGANSGTLTLGGQVGNVLRWESSTNNFGAVTTIVNTTTSEVYTNLNATTEYRAVVKSGTCSPANSAPAKLTIIPDPNTVNPVITASPTAVCEGGIVTVKITNTENGVKYYVKDNGTKIDSIIGNGLTVSKGVSMPIVGISRTLTFTASRGGCVEIPLGGSIAIRVDAGSNTNLTVTANPSTICVGGTTSITVFAAEPNVSYQLTDLGNPISGSVVGTGANIIFGPISGLAAGTHNLIVKATTAGCGTVNLSPPPVVVVNPDPGSTNPGFTDTTVCSNATNVKINITNSISGVTYTFKLGATVVGTVTASGSTASL